MTAHSFKLPPELLASFACQSQWHLHGRTVDGQCCRSVNAEQAWCHLNGYGREEIIIAFADDGCQMDVVASRADNKFAAAAFLEQGRLIYAEQAVIAALAMDIRQQGTLASPYQHSLPDTSS